MRPSGSGSLRKSRADRPERTCRPYTAWVAALVASAIGFGIKQFLPKNHPFMTGALILGIYGALYLALAWVLGLDEVKTAMKPILRRIGRN